MCASAAGTQCQLLETIVRGAEAEVRPGCECHWPVQSAVGVSRGSQLLYSYLKGSCSEVLNCFQVSCDRMRGNSPKLCQGRFSLDIRNNLFTEKVTKHWNRLPRSVFELPSLKVFKRHVDVTLSDMV